MVFTLNQNYHFSAFKNSESGYHIHFIFTISPLKNFFSCNSEVFQVMAFGFDDVFYTYLIIIESHLNLRWLVFHGFVGAPPA